MLARSPIVLVVIASVLGAFAPAQESAWPPGTAELPADPAIRFARLENGVRVACLNHEKPPGRVSLRLVVMVGSLDEEDDERGMAHFVEHMAFNGTRRFPGNTIDEWIRNRGMSPRMHANAFTTQARTIYQFDLPENEVSALTDGLGVLRQFVDGMLIEPDEVAAERGVIDAEERETPPRQSKDEERIDRLGAGGRRAVRPVLGTVAERAQFTTESLRAFHSKWYRSDNLILVVVGDVDVADAERACLGVFGALTRPATPLPKRAEPGIPTLADTSFAIEDPRRSEVSFMIHHPVVRRPQPASRESRIADARKTAIAGVADWWLSGDLLQVDSPVVTFRVATASQAGLDSSIDSMLLVFTCKPENAAAALARCAAAVQRLCVSGVSRESVDRVRLRWTDEVAAWPREHGSEPAAMIANDLCRRLASGDVPTAVDTEAALVRDSLAMLTARACTDAIRTAWSQVPLSISSVGPPGHAIDGAAVWAEACATAPANEPIAEDEHAGAATVDVAAAWPLASTDEGAPSPEARVHHDAIDLDEVRFANGIRLFVKATQFAAGQVLVGVNVGRGTLSLNDDERHAALAFTSALPRLGVAGIDPARVRAFASRRDVSLRCSIGEWRFELRGTTTSEDLGFQLEWMRAACADPGFDSEVLARAANAYLMNEAPAGSVKERVDTFLGELAGAPLTISAERLTKVDGSAVSAWLRQHWRGQPITIVVVGDVDVDAAVAAAARTFGRMSARSRPGPVAYRAVDNGVHRSLDLAATEPAGVVVVCASLGEEAQRGNQAILRVMGGLLRERLERRIREGMGATYAPEIWIEWPGTPHRCSVLLIRLHVPTGQEEAVLASSLAELRQFVATGVDAADVGVRVKQLLTEFREVRATNSHWLMQIGRVHTGDSTVEDLVSFEGDITNTTAADVNAAIAHYLDPARLSTLVLRVPAPK